MALTQVTGPYPIFTDLDGTPLDDGYLYIGEINEDPQTNPIQVYWDSALTIVATQPIRTSNGYAYRNGSPALLYTAGEFSITIRNKRQEFVLYSPLGYGFDPAAVSGSVVKNDFVGNGSTVNFTLSATPSTVLATNVFINGVYQEKDSYSLLGNVVTFSIAPPLNSSIEIMTNETGVINSGNANNISYTAGFAGAIAQSVQTKLEQSVSIDDFGAVGNGIANDTTALQNAIAAASTSGIPLYLAQGASYNIASPLVPSGKLIIYGNGARILTASNIIAINTLFPIELNDLIIEGPSGAYNAGGLGLQTTGVRNGTGIAPTFLSGVILNNVKFKNLSNIAAEFRFTANISANNVTVENCGFSGFFFYSCRNATVTNFTLDGLNGETTSGQLNAYGVTATSLTGVGVDPIRDPKSTGIVVDGFDIRNVPTWHALDTHGGDAITFRNGRIFDCRRGVVLTSLDERGASNCIVENVDYTNTFSASATNSNGTSKKGEAFWDIGASATYKNSNNRFTNCTAIGAGNPSSYEGATTVGNAIGGYYDIQDTLSYRCGWKVASDFSGTISARTVNPRSASVNAAVAVLDGNNITLNIEDWQTGPRNASVDTNVLNLGILFTVGRTNVVLNIESLDLRQAVLGEFVPSSGTVIAGTLNGNCRQDAELTLTGMTATVVMTAKFERQGGQITCQVPTQSGTSNTNAFTITGTPANFRPTATRGIGLFGSLNGGNYQTAYAEIASSGTITATPDGDNNVSTWVASGLKGIRSTNLSWTI